ncbi:TniQ family protein [Hydrogenophaga sp.]|uniref:TniQ family protein n=1 Tax=Hydrogenophaga sp. TaxID=1904254 RepID=UPI00391AADC6
MIKMPWFPWGETETLYSIVSRAHHISGRTEASATGTLAFGYARAWHQVHFERGLIQFCEYGGVHPTKLNRLVMCRTLMPFGRRFWGIGRTRVDEDYLLTGRAPVGERAHNYGGLWHNKELQLLKGCPTCAARDRDTLGGAVWHVEHQLPGLYFCTEHDTPLQGAWVGNSPEWVTAERMRAILRTPRTEDTTREIGRFLSVFLHEEKATRGSVLRLIERLLREANVLRPRRSKSDDLKAWWATKLPGDFVSIYPLIRWHAISDLFRSPRPHPILLASVLRALCTPEDFQSLIRSTVLQCDIDGNWDAIGDSAVWQLPRRVVWELEAGSNLAKIASDAGLAASALRHWLRRNPEVKRSRAAALADKQLQERRAKIGEALSVGRTRRDLLLTNSADVRWLELHDHAWISAQWGDLWSRSLRQRQRTLF